jgi:cytochrome P450
MQVAPRPSTFLPFGHGVHACPGNELAKLEMLVLIHHLVTGYRCVHLLSDPLQVSIYSRLSYSLWTRMTHGWLLPLSMGLRL